MVKLYYLGFYNCTCINYKIQYSRRSCIISASKPIFATTRNTTAKCQVLCPPNTDGWPRDGPHKCTTGTRSYRIVLITNIKKEKTHTEHTSLYILYVFNLHIYIDIHTHTHIYRHNSLSL